MMKALSLYELNSLVQSAIEATLPNEYWVEAELSEVREVRGHCFMELVQKDEGSHTPVAKAQAKCWKSTWQMMRPYFERVTGQTMHAGMKVMLRVYADFHVAYGFSWIVTDVNPEYTMGDLARRRQEIIQRLKEEGVFDLQRELHLPLFAQRIAVISSDGAAGYGDFCHQLVENEYGFSFSIELFPATMQGEQVEQSVISALNKINRRLADFDVVVIIRGGGATSDLSGFDTLALAENVANFPLPVITGIGHERDESVLDMVSHTRVKTPTAAAAFLIDHLASLQDWLSAQARQLASAATRELAEQQLWLSRMASRIPALSAAVIRKEELRLQRLQSQLVQAASRELQACGFRLRQTQMRLEAACLQKLQKESARLKVLAIKVQQLDPERMLQYGYSITLKDGKVVRDASALVEGDVLQTKLGKGSVTSIVKK